MKTRLTKDLVQIAVAGGGFKLDAGTRPISDLIEIASAAARGGGTIYLTGMNKHPTGDLIQISEAGKGHVVLEG